MTPAIRDSSTLRSECWINAELRPVSTTSPGDPEDDDDTGCEKAMGGRADVSGDDVCGDPFAELLNVTPAPGGEAIPPEPRRPMAPLRCGFCRPNDGTACKATDLGGSPPVNEVPAEVTGVPALLRRGLEVEEGEVKPSLPSAESAGLGSGAVGRLARRPRRELGLGPPGIESTAGTERANELLPAARLSMRIDAAIARTSTPELRRHDRCCSSIIDGAAVGCDVTRLRRRPMVDGSGPPALGAWSNSTSTVIGAGAFALLIAACATVTTALSIP